MCRNANEKKKKWLEEGEEKIERGTYHSET